jgi:hypothetical protein
MRQGLYMRGNDSGTACENYHKGRVGATRLYGAGLGSGLSDFASNSNSNHNSNSQNTETTDYTETTRISPPYGQTRVTDGFALDEETLLGEASRRPVAQTEQIRVVTV